MDNCNFCASCEKRLQWEAHYKEYLKRNPNDEEWVNKQRAIDALTLACQMPIEHCPHNRTESIFGEDEFFSYCLDCEADITDEYSKEIPDDADGSRELSI